MDLAAISSFVPIYFRIQQHLRAQMASGSLKPGDRLPSETELAQAYKTTRTTVRQALSRLVFEGAIVRKIGSGSFVAERTVDAPLDTTLWQSFEEQMAAQGSRVTFKLLRFERIPAPTAARSPLGLPADASVYRLERLRYLDGKLIGLEVRDMVESIGERMPDQGLRDTATQTLIEEVLGAPLGTIRVAIRAACANPRLARQLKVPAGSPLFIREHTFFAVDERPILHGEAIYREEFRFCYEIRGKRFQPGVPVVRPQTKARDTRK
jgi:DNA-binding GntR family transcriptional regulator